ncbi:hypothetical protein AB0L40_11630 [Patulibacter sp. NPDC049589]|uniref:hypothetical protein n=1 Tax=Patulibacter sp. NPDC049589 TaxID=3154731 RepID=UPI003418AF75
MDPEPTVAPLAGRMARLRARGSRGAATRAADRDAAVAAVVPVGAGPVAAVTAGPSGIDVSSVVAVLSRHGHEVRVTDRADEGVVPASVARHCHQLLADVTAALVRHAGGDLRVDVRLRTEDEQLVLAVQTLAVGDHPRPLELGARDEDLLRRRVEAAAGRATIRTTHGGNWLAMARLPL